MESGRSDHESIMVLIFDGGRFRFGSLLSELDSSIIEACNSATFQFGNFSNFMPKINFQGRVSVSTIVQPDTVPAKQPVDGSNFRR